MTASEVAPVRSSFARRVVRVALLDASAYEEVEADRGATAQALAVVMISALALGLGAVANHGVAGILWSTVHGIAAWYVWAWITYLIGTRLLPGPQTVSDLGELLRTIGFSSAPGILRLLVAVPPIALPVFLLANGWMLVSMVMAVRQALDYTSTWQAVAVCAIGFPIYAGMLALSLILLGPWPV